MTHRPCQGRLAALNARNGGETTFLRRAGARECRKGTDTAERPETILWPSEAERDSRVEPLGQEVGALEGEAAQKDGLWVELMLRSIWLPERAALLV